MKKVNLKGVSKAVWIRIVALFLVLANLISVHIFDFQLIPFTDEEIYEAVSWIVGVIAIWIGTYKNNSFTEEAQEADKVLQDLKANRN